MAENNAVTKEELREIMAEMRQEFRQELFEFRAETVARFEESEKKTASRFDEFEKKTAAQFEKSERKTAAQFEKSERKTAAQFEESERKTAAQFEKSEKRTAARFDATDAKMEKMHRELLEMMRAQTDMIWAQNKKIDNQYKYFQESHSRLLTGTDAVMKQLEDHRVERMSLGAIQNRHTREIEAIQKHLGIEGKNGAETEKAKPLGRPGRKKSK